MKYFKDYLYEMFPSYIEKQHYQAPLAYVLHLAICSFAETVRWWITENEEYTPEQIASYFLEYIN